MKEKERPEAERTNASRNGAARSEAESEQPGAARTDAGRTLGDRSEAKQPGEDKADAGPTAAQRLESDCSDEQAQEAFVLQLQLELKQMDDSLSEAEPDPQQMLALVREVQAGQRRRLLRDLLRFWLAAAVVLAGGIWAAGAAPAYYVGAQLALTAATFALVALAGLLRRPLEARRSGKPAERGGDAA
ncbi:DUF5345 family protein [Paenibacillus albicereus]|uniref:DUF5345 family protein n=1 Tax=Paenibacillus albicereus TaxID=2726185 RepID=A0A6H2H230_9BACL|nr:DUF5345 family protein [Paenibacillus albicereus]QJC53398.1 DUF5345 family protein [Paenibacillus albicereus]